MKSLSVEKHFKGMNDFKLDNTFDACINIFTEMSTNH